MTFENFLGKLGLPERRNKATPIFGKNWTWVFFSKLFLHGIAYDLERLFGNLVKELRTVTGRLPVGYRSLNGRLPVG